VFGAGRRVVFSGCGRAAETIVRRSQLQKVNVLGVFVDATNLIEGAAQVTRWIAEDERTYVCVTSVHGISWSRNGSPT
jgi:hypothetical protein